MGASAQSFSSGQNTFSGGTKCCVVPTGPNVTGFTVLSADTGATIGSVRGNYQLRGTMSSAVRIAVRADAEKAGSVVFTDDSGSRVESTAPYALKGDVNGKYVAWTPAPGVYRIWATPYSGPDGTGTAGPKIRFRLEVLAPKAP